MAFGAYILTKISLKYADTDFFFVGEIKIIWTWVGLYQLFKIHFCWCLVIFDFGNQQKVVPPSRG